jgi:hypothetical protein
MAFAITLSTESGDDYIYAMDGTPTQEEIQAFVENKLGDEFYCVVNYEYDSTYDIEFELEYKEESEDDE